MTRTRSGFGNTENLASRLTERIRIELPVDSADGQGGTIRGWTELCSCFAEVVPLYSDTSEREIAGQLTMRALYRIVIRARTDVRADMRVIWRSKVFNIRAVVESAASVDMIVEEGVAI